MIPYLVVCLLFPLYVDLRKKPVLFSYKRCSIICNRLKTNFDIKSRSAEDESIQETMKLSVIILVAAILATILLPLLGSARSIPATSSKTVQTPVRREANPADRSLSGAQNGPEALEDITDELALANLSIPSYLKDLYVNFTIPDGLENNDKMAVNTIRSYENRASSKLKLLFSTIAQVSCLTAVCLAWVN